jgi:hypothetical protein
MWAADRTPHELDKLKPACHERLDSLHNNRIVINQTVSGSNESSIFVELVNGRS